MRKFPAPRVGLVGFSGSWPKVFHALREESDRSLCYDYIKCDFFFDYDQMAKVNEDWAISLTPCMSCFGQAVKEWPA